MLDNLRQSPAAIVGLACLVSAPPMLIASQLAIDPPMPFAELKPLSGPVLRATNIAHYKSYGSSFEFLIKTGENSSIPLVIIKQQVKRQDLEALAGKAIDVLYGDDMIYELKSGGRTYFGYDDVANMVWSDRRAFSFSGTICGVAGILLLGWWWLRREKSVS